MDRNDLEKCYLPFTTSKLSKEEHLNNIETMGFRGEALNSITAVAKVSVKTKSKESDTGYELSLEGGKRKRIKPVGMDKGTIVEIRDLFFNVPARKKFLKTDIYESKQIIFLVEKFALANWDKSFKLINNGKEIISVHRGNDLLERIGEIYGNKKDKLLEVGGKSEYLRIHGYIGSPSISSYTNTNSSIFINGRYIENKRLAKTVKQSYGKLIESTSYPFYILFLELMPNLVNVNIHPQKKEVNFWNDTEVENFVKDNIREALEKKAITYDTDYFGNPLKKASKYQLDQLKENTFNWNIKGIEEKEDYEEIFQIGNTYIVTHTKEGLILIDQHAAHESILYEQYMERYKENIDKNTENFIDVNELVEVSNTIKYAIEENIEILNSYGFDITNFGGNTFKISSVPSIFKDHDLLKLLEELVENIGDKTHIDEKTKQTIAFLSCRGAVKAGEKLTEDEMRNLAKKLEQSQGYLTCPHGRPTRIVIPLKDMGKIFKRI